MTFKKRKVKNALLSGGGRLSRCWTPNVGVYSGIVTVLPNGQELAGSFVSMSCAWGKAFELRHESGAVRVIRSSEVRTSEDVVVIGIAPSGETQFAVKEGWTIWSA